MKDDLSSIGFGLNAIALELQPGREALAQHIQSLFGDAVEIQVGLTNYCGRPGVYPRCADVRGSTALPSGLHLTVRLNQSIVGATAGSVIRTIVFRQDGPTVFNMDTGQPLEATVVRPGTVDVVARFGGAIAGTGYQVRLTNGQEKTLKVIVGLWKCDGRVGSALASGHYGVRVAIGNEGRTPLYIAPETPLGVTNG